MPRSQRILAGEKPERDRDLAPATNAQLLSQDVAVRFRRSGGDPEPRPDLVVRASCSDQCDDLSLTFRYCRRPSFRGQFHHGHDATPSIE